MTLSRKKREKIMELSEAGFTPTEIKEKLGCCYDTIRRVLKGNKQSSVKQEKILPIVKPEVVNEQSEMKKNVEADPPDSKKGTGVSEEKYATKSELENISLAS